MISLLCLARAGTASLLCLACLSACSMHQSLVSVPAGGTSSVLPPTSTAFRGRTPGTAAKQSALLERLPARRAPAEPALPEVMPQPFVPVLRVRNLESGAIDDAANAAALAVVNGSRLQVSMTGPEFTSGIVLAGDSTAAMVPAGTNRWTATLRYIDSSNPPALHPSLHVQMQTARGSRTFQIPVTELHQ